MPTRRVCQLLSSFLAVLLIDIASLVAQTWTKHATDGFEVEFSGEVKVKVHPVTAGGTLRSTSYTQVGSDFAFEVAVSLHRNPTQFEKAVAYGFDGFKCATVAETPLRLPGGRAREIRGIDCEGGKFRADVRYFLVARRFYQVYALHPANGSRAGEARRFIESFRVTGQR